MTTNTPHRLVPFCPWSLNLATTTNKFIMRLFYWKSKQYSTWKALRSAMWSLNVPAESFLLASEEDCLAAALALMTNGSLRVKKIEISCK